MHRMPTRSAEVGLFSSLVLVFQRKLRYFSSVSLLVFSQTRFAAEVPVSISDEECDWVTVDLLPARVTSEPNELARSDGNVRVILHDTRYHIVGER
jgi:hypothetical protein